MNIQLPFINIYSGISTFVGVEPTNVAWPPSAVMSDVLNHYTTEASKTGCSSSLYMSESFQDYS